MAGQMKAKIWLKPSQLEAPVAFRVARNGLKWPSVLSQVTRHPQLGLFLSHIRARTRDKSLKGNMITNEHGLITNEHKKI
jgi:hypothetical protein